MVISEKPNYLTFKYLQINNSNIFKTACCVGEKVAHGNQNITVNEQHKVKTAIDCKLIPLPQVALK